MTAGSSIAQSPEPIIRVENLQKTYQMGEVAVHALRGISLNISRGEFVAIMGHSGSGKSTFMNLIGCLDRGNGGRYMLEGVDASTRNRDELAKLRNAKIGFVFQGFNLLSRTTALENVELPLVYAGVPRRERRRRAEEALKIVNLAERMDHRSNQLSGGQQQRVAIARALVVQPAIILADEPTGNLDSHTAVEIMGVFQQLNRQHHMTILVVTHEPDIAQYTRRIVHFHDGRISNDAIVAKPRDAAADLATMPALDEAVQSIAAAAP